MQSIEFVPEMADDVAANVSADGSGGKPTAVQLRKKTPPGRNLVFGDLFEVRRSVVSANHSSSSGVNGSGGAGWSSNVRGPSKCLVFICKSLIGF